MSDDLMTGHDRKLVRSQVAFDQLQVRPADGACRDREDELVRFGMRIHDVDEPQW